MENFFQMNFTREQVNGISNLGLAHIGDGVYELMVRSYLCAKGNQTVKTQSMVPNIKEFEYIVTDSEMEALLLECNLIKKYHPYYNIQRLSPYIQGR